MSQFTVEQGDIIRSYDFKPMAGRADCFVEGRVIDTHNTEHGYSAYKIEVTKDQFGDEVSVTPSQDCRVGHTVYVPWRVSFSEYAGRILNLSR